MKFNYLVKHNGVYYKAGEDVPVEPGASTGAFTPSFKPSDEVEETETKVEDVPIVAPKEEKKFTKTEINRMSTAELKNLAKANGLSDDYSGSELKKMLIERLV